MFFTLIALWKITFILLYADWRTEYTRWVALATFAGGLGGLAETINDIFRPYLSKSGVLTPSFDKALEIVFNLSYFGTHIAGPYFYIIFAICYCGFFKRRDIRISKVVLLIPVLYMLFITPFNPIIDINFSLVSVWVIPYIIASSILFIRCYVKEKNPQIKRNRLFVMIAAVIPVNFVIYSNYLARSFGYCNLFRHNSIIIAMLFIFIMIIIVKNNFLGIRLRFEKQRLDSAMKAVFSGSSILNHTIKNEILKIQMSADACKSFCNEIKEMKNIENIMESSNYLLNMITRIQHNMREIELKKEVVVLNDLIWRVIKLNKHTLEEKNIILSTNIPGIDIEYPLDVVHVTETINNILKNSLEAISEKGEIDLVVSETKKILTIAITDDGPGISKENLLYVKDPFFTTKKRTLNFGIGLSYCYNVMQQHKGELIINSEQGKGTTVFLNFPKEPVFFKKNYRTINS